ncbi:uncharacterized protein EDB91DRAFT_197456 [Suillus paluster]|uniref:uncharacterized protein n=1 Tax=Suillus paluster TaxID=48578 RepID=UPI001B86AA80|nr:uncharacterized protein EDB91DRAFT_197456 [Suillus paluster]KAG1744654.1 hypothetical protein EDB91DRAFT_197456 [Suillus paluster]
MSRLCIVPRILDAVHLALIVHGNYYYLVINFANILALPVVVWSAQLQIPFDVIIIWGVHFLYVHRIWIVNRGRSKVLPITVGTIVALCSGVAITLIWATYQSPLFSDLNKYNWAIYSTLGTISFLDILIASSLCYLLATSRTGFSGTDSLVTRLMLYTISTGCLTSVFSLTTIITFAVMPTNFIFLSIEFWVAKLYVNSYIAVLNAPYYLKADAAVSENTDSSELYNRYRPELSGRVSQDESFSARRKNILKQTDNEVLHLTRPIQAPMRPIAVSMEMNSFSSV